MEVRIVTGYKPEDRKDRRYRTLVRLQRSDRPRYWTFNCPNCQQPMAELNGTEIYELTDFYNPKSADNGAVGVRCPGSYCRRWYFFLLT